MHLSAVIVTHNSSGVLEPCCRSLRSLVPDAELIVVDNASTDDTARLCRELDGVTLLANSINVGFGRACNQGVNAASGSHVLIVNPDVDVNEVDAQAFEAESRVEPFGLVAPIVEQNSGGGSTDEHWARDLFRHVLGPLRPREFPSAPKLTRRGRAWWPAGALLLVKREEFIRIGGFDPRFFLYYEDRDLARRYRSAGLPVRQTRAMRAVHHGGLSSTGELAGVVVRQGWSYLSWIEYLCTWDGREVAVRAARSAGRLWGQVDRALAVLERVGPMSRRAARKRRELAALDSFVRWQCSFAEGTAEDGFCPMAREIVGAT